MRVLLLFFSLSLTLLFARVITFSPLPMDKAPKLLLQYSPMLQYLEKETGNEYKFIFSASYDDIIKNFEDGKVDVVELGPLPFVKLQEKYEWAKPFLTFLTKEGEDSYTCEMLTTDKNIKTIADIDKNVHINLTRKISTCGYLMSEFILRNSGKSLENLDYEYVGAHSTVLLHTLLEVMSVGCAKSTVVGKYRSFNFTTLANSPKIPGFAFVANSKTMSQEDIQKIEKALLKLKPLSNSDDASFTKDWSENIKYGCAKTKDNAYSDIVNALKIIEIPKDDAQ